MTQEDDDAVFSLARFTDAQEPIYKRVLAELRSGKKRSHWIWFIFPQIDGLGNSVASRHFAIKNLEEARAYLQHPVVGTRLRECSEIVLGLEGRTVSDIFGSPDDMKVKSCMTLFDRAAEEQGSVFGKVLEKYYDGERDERTLELLKWEP